MANFNFEFNTPIDIFLGRGKVNEFHNWHSLKSQKKKIDYIWDEDLTIRQNRELTAQHNATIDEEIKAMQAKYNEAEEEYNAAVIKYIKEQFDYTDVNCNDAQARIIWSFCLTNHEENPHEWIEDIVGLYIDMINNQGNS